MPVVVIRNCAACACEPEPILNCPGCGGAGGFTKADMSTKDGVVILSVIPSTPYTPGPWTVDHVTQVGDHLTKNSGDWQANARLIAAAPEMLAALKLAEEDTPPDDEPRNGLGASVFMSWECIDCMRAAISKAEGSQ